MDKVLREMTRGVISLAVNTTVNQYMRSRAIKPSIPRALAFQPTDKYDDNDPVEFMMDPVGRASK